ncbi:MAG: D-alanyl-D-alanine carboxypeptidase family protein [bacterium]
MMYSGFVGKVMAILMAVALLLAGQVSVFAEENADTEAPADGGTALWQEFGEDVSADAACLMDANTGIVLYEKNMEQSMYPASVTKIMTTLLALENGNLSDSVAMTPEGTQYAVSGSSNLYTQNGEIFTLEQLLYGTMLKSANDMATQVGYHIGGNSLDNFFEMMNSRAASLGARNTHFHSACGMPDEQHWTCAYDLALIMAAAIREPMFRTIGQTREYAIPPTNLNSETRMFASHNLLLVDDNYRYDGIIAGKTGYTDAAQSTLVEAASRNGLDLVAVVLHEPDSVTAAVDTIRMMDFGFANYQNVQVGKSEYAVSGGRALLPNGASADQLTISEGEPYETENGTFVRWDYLFDGRPVGFVEMTAANAEAYHVELYGPTNTPSPEPTPTGTQGAPTKATPEEVNPQKTGKSGGITGILFIAFVVIACLAAIGVVVFAVLLHRAKVEAANARRRKQELRRRAMADEKARQESAAKAGAAANAQPQRRKPSSRTTDDQAGPIGAGPSPAVKDAAARYIEKQEAKRRAQENEEA